VIDANVAHYRILGTLGRGGMGDVYRARDTKLGRDVAIKVLPDKFTSDSERCSRFQREARVLASLNHPNIEAIYELAEWKGRRFLVLELIEGDTLADKLRRGKLPLDEAFQTAQQIAEALDVAHRKGIIHRDLKPANIKLTAEGKVKVLDFGLARRLELEALSAGESQSTQLTERTVDGEVLGTVPYMSPEQSRGRPVDKQTDIWAFGCVFYEMLTGRPPFSGKTIVDLLTSINRDDPNWLVLAQNAPPAIVYLTRQCLQKDVRHRLRDIGDALIQIEELQREPAAGPQVIADTRNKTLRLVLWILAGMIAGGILTYVWTSRLPQAISQPGTTKRLVIHLPEPDRIAFARSVPYGIGRPSIALSPDGKYLAYVVEHGSERQLYLRAIDKFDGNPLPQTEGAFLPFFSPDGQWIGFFTDTQLKKVFVGGGSPVVLCEARNVFGACWRADNSIFFSPDDGSSLFQVSGDGGTPKPIAQSPSGVYSDYPFFFPYVLPGTEFLLVNRTVYYQQGTILLYSPKTGEQRVLIQGGTGAQYVPTGHLLFARQGELLVTPFDINRLEITGVPVPVLEGVRTESYGSGQFSFSLDGTLAYVPGGSGLDAKLTWVNRLGNLESLPVQTQTYGDFRLSPDAQHLAATIYGTTVDIWVYEFKRNAWTRLTSQGVNTSPLWTPDGKRVVYAASVDGSASNLFWQASDASSKPERLTTSQYIQTPGSWSPDGKTLLVRQYNPTGQDILALQFDGHKIRMTPYLNSPANESFPTFSPDGGWVAYASTESGRVEVYIASYPTAERRFQISTNGGEEPKWSPKGNELFYRNGQKWMKVDISLGSSVAVGKPENLFEGPFVNVPGYSYDVGPGAQKFLVLQEAGAGSASEIRIVFNWFNELRAQVSKPR
jgi:serine/threonine protein kinase/Tol biopolymer transport system component